MGWRRRSRRYQIHDRTRQSLFISLQGWTGDASKRGGTGFAYFATSTEIKSHKTATKKRAIFAWSREGRRRKFTRAFRRYWKSTLSFVNLCMRRKTHTSLIASLHDSLEKTNAAVSLTMRIVLSWSFSVYLKRSILILYLFRNHAIKDRRWWFPF